MKTNVKDITRAMEDHLEAIALIKRRNDGVVRVKDIASFLEVKNPTVNEALKKLVARKLVKHEKYGYVYLTPQGEKTAGKIMKKHRILADFFMQVLGIDEVTAEADACRAEHAISAHTSSRLKKFIKFSQEGSCGISNEWIDHFSCFVKAGEKNKCGRTENNKRGGNGMKKKICTVLCILSYSLWGVGLPYAAADGASEIEALRQEMRAMRDEMTHMKRSYDAQIREMQSTIDELRSTRPVPAHMPSGEATPLPGMGKPAFELPDISVIGNVIGNYGTDKSDPNRNKVYLEEVELALQGYLYPDIWANFIATLHRESDGDYEADIEEGYIEFQATPIPGLSALAGRKLIGFGKINPVHAHHWNYVDRPAVLESYLGDHGLRGQGVNLSYLIPLPFFAQADLGIWYVDGDHHHHHHHHDDDDELGLADRTYSARLWSSFPIAHNQEFELGMSGVTGYGPEHEEHHDKVWIGGLDATYRFFGEGARRLLYQGELLYLHRKVPDMSLDRWGFYQHLNYRFDKNWDAGLRFDWLETPYEERDTKYSISGILTHSLTETTRLRLQYKYDPKDVEHTVYLQAIFGLGPHAHALE